MNDTTYNPPTSNYNGVDYVGIYVSPRGFANESATYLARADDEKAVARLARQEAIERQPGDGYLCYWLDSDRIAQEIADLGPDRKEALTIGLYDEDDVLVLE